MNNPTVFPLRQGECLCGRERLVDNVIQIGYLELVKYSNFLINIMKLVSFFMIIYNHDYFMSLFSIILVIT